jgi:hypothetical protein
LRRARTTALTTIAKNSGKKCYLSARALPGYVNIY